MAPTPFTVFLPTYNRPDYTREALESCLRQTYPHFRIVVSDDTPSDAVHKVVEAAGSDKIEYRRNTPALGLVKKLNWFLDHCPTEWAVTLGDDDSFAPGYLEALAKLIAAHPHASLIRTRYRVIDSDGKEIKIDRAEKEEAGPFEAFASYFKPWDAIHTNISGVCFKPVRMKQAGGFPEYYRAYHSDTVGWSALAALDGFLFVQAPLVNLRMFDPTALSSKVDENFGEILKLERAAFAETGENWKRLAARADNPADRAAAEVARQAYVRFFSDVTFHYADKALEPRLKNLSRGSKEAIDILDRLEQTGIPMPKRFAVYRFLCKSGAFGPIVLAILGIYRKLAIRARSAKS